MEQVSASVNTAPVDRAEALARFERFAAAEAGSLLWLAKRLVGEADAQDLAQDALLKAYRGLDRFRWEASLKSWVRRILVNEGLKRLRRRQLSERVKGAFRSGGPRPEGMGLSEWAGPDELAGQAEQARTLDRAMQRLSPRQRAVVVLRHVEGLPVAEVAETLGLGPGTVKTHLVRALRQLRAVWPEAEEAGDEQS
ncbi:MAG: RNA polymerase sigma factor [Deltaproteobacteria bacterium]|nr:RNA polymerase sigma factor [Deltaproteobacteria bacterium]